MMRGVNWRKIDYVMAIAVALFLLLLGWGMSQWSGSTNTIGH